MRRKFKKKVSINIMWFYSKRVWMRQVWKWFISKAIYKNFSLLVFIVTMLWWSVKQSSKVISVDSRKVILICTAKKASASSVPSAKDIFLLCSTPPGQQTGSLTPAEEARHQPPVQAQTAACLGLRDWLSCLPWEIQYPWLYPRKWTLKGYRIVKFVRYRKG